MKKINEIFYSIQGEGYHTGTPAVFVRFSGCNLACDFCDTQHADGRLMSEAEIVSEVENYPAKHVVLTGGEPGLYITESLIQLLKGAGKYIQIETNGTVALPAGIDWVTCSPKEGGELHVTAPDELKVVYTGQDLSEYEAMEVKFRCLQPCSGRNTAGVVAYILQHPQWHLSLQTHKLIDIQ
ncbi:MAG: 7-carboxy-7-deazaguanine synthase QueE [Tannerellaceae bacterium]|nr:7-carboxy-7-deazaguanine synthase QueE [Tannerellaceae bacterium]